jgi:putative ABC transport system substrate-binding protein
VILLAIVAFVQLRKTSPQESGSRLKVAVLYTVGEPNSAAAVAQMQQALQEAEVETVLIGIGQASEIAAATLQAAQQADAIWVPADNLVVSAMPTVARVALEQKKPLFVSDPPSVERGALACVGVDYEKAGAQSAKMAARVLKEKIVPSEIPLYEESEPPVHINPDTARALTLAVSPVP